jgi:hypothetical protein
LVNGKNFDFEDLKLFINGVQAMDLQEINYSDEQEWELQYGTGARPIGAGRGNYKASGDLTLGRSEFDTLNNLARVAGKSIYDFKPFVIVASYATKVEGDDLFVKSEVSPLHTDMLVNCIFTKRDFGIKQNDKKNTVKIEFICPEIK